MKHHLLAPCLALLTHWAAAGTLQINVTDLDGKPAADVVVLLSTAARPAPVPASTPVVITQEYSRFGPFVTVVPLGSTVRFTNKDNYDHHVRSTPSGPLGSTAPAVSFELRLAAAAMGGQTGSPATPAPRNAAATAMGDIKLDQPGPIGLGCHLHSSMRGQIYVSPTPWFARTDATGVARIENAPEGAAELTLWHPDQLADQPLQRLQLGAAPAAASGRLNFTPRRRRG